MAIGAWIVGGPNLTIYRYYADALLPYGLGAVPLVTVMWLGLASLWGRPGGPFAYLRQQVTVEAMARYVAGLVLLLALIPFLGTFTSVKGALSAGGFTHELKVAEWDRWLHGTDAAEWLALTLGDRLLVLAEVNYNVGWQVYHLLFLTLMVLHPRLAGVRRFYLAFYGAMWVLLGNVLAAWFISAGPAFYAEVTGDTERFAGLEAMLYAAREHTHAAWRFQQYLWQHWQAGRDHIGTGISAFPSVHVFVVVCNALFTWRYIHRGWGVVAAVYALAVLVSSAYLGWHYLVDGYVAAALGAALFTCFARHRRPRSGTGG